MKEMKDLRVQVQHLKASKDVIKMEENQSPNIKLSRKSVSKSIEKIKTNEAAQLNTNDTVGEEEAGECQQS